MRDVRWRTSKFGRGNNVLLSERVCDEPRLADISTDAGWRLSDKMAAPTLERDLRLDFFRGLALMMIFVNHIPGNVFSHLTLANLGFSDAAEIFVFVAGMSATFAYGKAVEKKGWLGGSLAVFARLRRLYAVHLAVFAVVTAVTVFAAYRFGDPMYLEQMMLDSFVSEPTAALLHVVTLTYQPAYLDILPLYIVLLAFVPAILLLFRLHAFAPLALSVAVFAATRIVDLNLPNYPDTRSWYFNPFAWQLLFVAGATVAHLLMSGRRRMPAPSLVTAGALLYVGFAFVVAAPWTDLPGLANAALIPATLLPPVDKTNLSLLRLVNVLAQAWLVAAFVSRTSPMLTNFFGRLLVASGRHSLDVFALGVVLSVIGAVVVKETGHAPAIQLGFTLFGFAAMTGLALGLDQRAKGKLARSRALAEAEPLTKSVRTAI